MSSVSEGRYTMYHQQQPNGIPTTYEYSGYPHSSYDSAQYTHSGVRTAAPRVAESQQTHSPIPPQTAFDSSAQPYQHQVYGHHYAVAPQPPSSQWPGHPQPPHTRHPPPLQQQQQAQQVQQQPQQHQSPHLPPHQSQPPQPQHPHHPHPQQQQQQTQQHPQQQVPQQQVQQQQVQQQRQPPPHWQSPVFGGASASYPPAQQAPPPPPPAVPNTTPPTMYRRPVQLPPPTSQSAPVLEHRVPQSPLTSSSPRTGIVRAPPLPVVGSSQRSEREVPPASAPVSTPALPPTQTPVAVPSTTAPATTSAAPPTDGPPSLDFVKLMDSCRLIIDASAALGASTVTHHAPPSEMIERMLGSASFAVQMLTASSYAVLAQSPTENTRALQGGDDGGSARKRVKHHHEATNAEGQVCLGCKATTTPEWRRGPMGPRTLCNACGLVYAKLIKKRSRAEAGQNGHSTTAGDADSSESSDDDGAFARRSEG